MASHSVLNPSPRLDQVSPEPLHLSYDVVELDFLSAIEFGAVLDGKPDDEVVWVDEHLRYLLRAPEGPAIGFELDGVSAYDLDSAGAEVWEGPRFDVPVLGLREASAGEIILSARATFAAGQTTGVALFWAAVEAKELGDLALAANLWRWCLEVGEMKAHFGLGYTLLDLGRHREGYRHLRFYTELAPWNSWAWTWLGKACEALGDRAEAISCYRRAVELEELGSFETDAQDLLDALGG